MGGGKYRYRAPYVPVFDGVLRLEPEVVDHDRPIPTENKSKVDGYEDKNPCIAYTSQQRMLGRKDRRKGWSEGKGKK